MDWDAAFHRLSELEHLEDNYDSEGSLAPNRDYLIAAQDYMVVQEVAGIRPPDHISVEGDGSVLLEWLDDNYRTEALIDSTSTAKIMCASGDECTFIDIPI